MKKYLIIGLIIAVIGAMVLVPMLKNSGGGDFSEDEIPAMFAFKDNLATKWDEAVPVQITINAEDIAKVELFYNDSLFQTWENPTTNLKYLFKAGYYGLGTRAVKLLTTMKDGKTFVDERMVRVLSDIVPEIWIAKIVKDYPHNAMNFTQGLEFNEGVLFESTGQKGQSKVAHINLENGSSIKEIGLDGTYFGEGITIFGDKVFQLTWQEQKCFIYNKNTLIIEDDIPYTGEGWGLCNDGKSLIMSNGTERLVFRNPKTFEIERTIEVCTHQGPVVNLNELEYHDGLIYANVWMTNKVAVIDALNGKVVAEIDGTDLVREGRGNGDVLNGIAYNPKTNKWYMTGKNWMKLFEVNFSKAAA
jgi:glutaminyl-peptide cyclotransferase